MPLYEHLIETARKGVITGAAVALGVKVDKGLQTWMKAPGLGSLAAQAHHER
jgi:hypothetical protein